MAKWDEVDAEVKQAQEGERDIEPDLDDGDEGFEEESLVAAAVKAGVMAALADGEHGVKYIVKQAIVEASDDFREMLTRTAQKEKAADDKLATATEKEAQYGEAAQLKAALDASVEQFNGIAEQIYAIFKEEKKRLRSARERDDLEARERHFQDVMRQYHGFLDEYAE